MAIKRKRDHEPVESLILRQKKQKTESVQYRLKAVSADQHTLADAKILSGLKAIGPDLSAPATATPQQSETITSSTSIESVPRHFQLRKKRGADTAGLATFYEKRQRGLNAVINALPQEESPINTQISADHTPLKRPGANSQELKWRSATRKAEHERAASNLTPRPTKKDDPALADALHRFALEEIEREEQGRPRVKYQPKRPIRRMLNRDSPGAVESPAQAEPQVHIQDEDVDMDLSDDENYVVDIYVRTEGKSPDSDITNPASHSVGYLIITEQDEPHWEMYLEDEEDNEKVNSDDEDENAEDYYGADYPEDEVASDDEAGRGAYGYRHGGSDDETWDSDTGDFSDEEDRMRNPWKTYPWTRTKPGAGSDEDEMET